MSAVRTGFGLNGAGDVNYDGIVDALDLSYVRQNFGQACSAGNAASYSVNYFYAENNQALASDSNLTDYSWLFGSAVGSYQQAEYPVLNVITEDNISPFNSSSNDSSKVNVVNNGANADEGVEKENRINKTIKKIKNKLLGGTKMLSGLLRLNN